MHEASLAQGLLNLALGALADYNASQPLKTAGKIKQIICGAGLIAGFEERTLIDCFGMFAEETPAEGSELIIKTIPLDCECRQCGKKFQLKQRHFVCPYCQNPQINFNGGNGLILQAINVDCEEEDG